MVNFGLATKARLRTITGHTLETKIRNYQAYLLRAAQDWAGTGAEYVQWAETGASRMLRNVAENLYVEIR